MYKKIKLIGLLLAMTLVLSSCSTDNFQPENRILAPTNENPPLDGIWTLNRQIQMPYNYKETDENFEEEAVFHKDAVIIGDEYIQSPSYKTRNVSMEDYFLYNYRVKPIELGITNSKARIVTIFSDDKFFYELIKLSDEEFLIYKNDLIYLFRKTDEKIKEEKISNYMEEDLKIARALNPAKVERTSSGLLLGLKKEVFTEEGEDPLWEYRTLWIRFNDGKLSSVYEKDNIFLPRKKGFWEISSSRKQYGRRLEDIIDIRNISVFSTEENLRQETFRLLVKEEVEESISREILFVGNDYISIEEKDLQGQKFLKVYPIDYISQEESIRLSDIIDEGLAKTYDDTDNFGLFRRNGYWILKGREFSKIDGEDHQSDYNIRIIPPKELVSYDELWPGWIQIKDKNPKAVDAYASPNKDIVAIVELSNIKFYPVEDGIIFRDEIARIELDREEIVMAEWATGNYTNTWEKEIIENLGRPLDP